MLMLLLICHRKFHSQYSYSNAAIISRALKDRDGLNVCVAIELSKDIHDGREVLTVNDVRSIHGRDAENIIKPIAYNNTLMYADNEKGLDWLSSASSDYQQETVNQDLNYATKVVETFDNPKDSEKFVIKLANQRDYRAEGIYILHVRTQRQRTMHCCADDIAYERNTAITGSRYAKFEKNGVDYEIRSANHTKSYSRKHSGNGVYMSANNNSIYSVEVDLSENDMLIDDITKMMDEVEKFNSLGILLRETAESGKMASEDERLKDMSIVEQLDDLIREE